MLFYNYKFILFCSATEVFSKNRYKAFKLKQYINRVISLKNKKCFRLFYVVQSSLTVKLFLHILYVVCGLACIAVKIFRAVQSCMIDKTLFTYIQYTFKINVTHLFLCYQLKHSLHFVCPTKPLLINFSGLFCLSLHQIFLAQSRRV